jgi:hypothetical protein
MSKVPHLPIVEAWKVASGKLLWWPNGSLLRWWSRSTVELLLLLLSLLRLELSLLVLWVISIILLLLWPTQLTPRWGIHHVVLRRITTRTTASKGSRHNLLPLLHISLCNGLHQPLLLKGGSRHVIERQVGDSTRWSCSWIVCPLQ